ncbi:hypothetical protein [Legionella yabuuchiae]|uniref:hypothetical protein n=1 Tax=Legionella yabuuchiae TaxID=376727 RepID=UPI0010555235|nr:hypothetical protein [Legionella yabuuchiae]
MSDQYKSYRKGEPLIKVFSSDEARRKYKEALDAIIAAENGLETTDLQAFKTIVQQHIDDIDPTLKGMLDDEDLARFRGDCVRRRFRLGLQELKPGEVYEFSQLTSDGMLNWLIAHQEKFGAKVISHYQKNQIGIDALFLEKEAKEIVVEIELKTALGQLTTESLQSLKDRLDFIIPSDSNKELQATLAFQPLSQKLKDANMNLEEILKNTLSLKKKGYFKTGILLPLIQKNVVEALQKKQSKAPAVDMYADDETQGAADTKRWANIIMEAGNTDGKDALGFMNEVVKEKEFINFYPKRVSEDQLYRDPVSSVTFGAKQATFRGKRLESNEVIRSMIIFKETSGWMRKEVPKYGVLKQGHGYVSDYSDPGLSNAHQARVALKQVSMLLANRETGKKIPVTISGKDPKMVKKVYAALLIVFGDRTDLINLRVPGVKPVTNSKEREEFIQKNLVKHLQATEIDSEFQKLASAHDKFKAKMQELKPSKAEQEAGLGIENEEEVNVSYTPSGRFIK